MGIRAELLNCNIWTNPAPKWKCEILTFFSQLGDANVRIGNFPVIPTTATNPNTAEINETDKILLPDMPWICHQKIKSKYSQTRL